MKKPLSTSILGIALLITLAIPFVLRPNERSGDDTPLDTNLPEDTLIIVSPHWEGIRAEFGRAFSEWTVQRFNRRTKLEWLDIGGTSDAIRYVKSEFTRSRMS